MVTAFEKGFTAIQTQSSFRPVLAVTAEARGFEERTDVFGIGQSFLGRRRGKFAEIELAQVRAFGREGQGARGQE
jgi:hypothetical protein